MQDIIKKIVVSFDKRFTNGNIRWLYKKFKLRKRFFRGKRAAFVTEPVPDMILMQYNVKEYMQYQFYDLSVRYLAIEEYYQRNNFGFELYKKMHVLGGNYGQINENEKYYRKRNRKKRGAKFGIGKEEHSIEQFKELIESFEKNGYDENSYVMADRNLLSMNGSHRTAIAVYKKQEFINVELKNRLFDRRYSVDWFWQNGFTRNEIKKIDETVHAIVDDCRNQIGNYFCILYPPAIKYFDDITEDIKVYDTDNIKVVDYVDYNCEVDDFVGFLRTIYCFDSINELNLESKIKAILKAADIKDRMVSFRIISLKINNPLYRLKADNGMPESVALVRLKENIRKRYRSKEERFSQTKSGEYKHDVIIHSTDNYLSNKAMRIVLNMGRDLSDLILRLSNCSYCIVESSTDKMSSRFPQNFYLNEDIDIFVLKNELERVTEITEKFCKELFDDDWVAVETVKSNYGKRVKVLLRDTLIVMFDFMVCLPGLKESYIQDCVLRCDVEPYRHLKLEDEVMVRLAKYIQNKDKNWHADFIKVHGRKEHWNNKAFCSEVRAYKTFLKLIKPENRKDNQ